MDAPPDAPLPTVLGNGTREGPGDKPSTLTTVNKLPTLLRHHPGHHHYQNTEHDSENKRFTKQQKATAAALVQCVCLYKGVAMFCKPSRHIALVTTVTAGTLT